MRSLHIQFIIQIIFYRIVTLSLATFYFVIDYFDSTNCSNSGWLLSTEATRSQKQTWMMTKVRGIKIFMTMFILPLSR